MRVLLLGLLFVLMLGLQQLHAHFPAGLGSRTVLVFGFLLLVGFLLGELLARYLPRITGYLLAGMICGPHLVGFVDVEVVEHLGLVDSLALVLIAFTAGAEIKISRLRPRARGILSICLSQSLVVFGAVTGALWLLAELLPLFNGLSGAQILGVAAILGIIATATSPSTAVAVILEARAKGPVTDTVLGAAVLKDILVLAGFSLILASAQPAFGLERTASDPGLGMLLLHVVISLAAGSLFGGLMILYLRYVAKQTVLFVVGAAFLLISLADAFHLDSLLSAVAVGFTVSNFSRQGEAFLHGLERAAGPIFLIFFCMAGAGLNLGVLAGLWQMALVYIVLRAAFTWLGTWLGALAAREVEPVRKLAWCGFLGQAGVSLGLAALVRTRFPEVGGAVADLVVGAIVVNQILGPVAFRWALDRSGETGGSGSKPLAPRSKRGA